ncbi:hypothetical protein VHEMI01593 [[Torrubiella] hemipterigena]|uniref:Uncharacterized protein n=1 Tax=[Torrubiella] hemipterigena TaxID=1531966 RepID=A0A0A1STH2_9HYPO|nr:hypothetical protein VHEMI01593 [[Torrubiella] hemipterigena]
MTQPIHQLDDLLRQHDESDDTSFFHIPLGFTIYRTDYTTENSDQLWTDLVEDRTQWLVKQVNDESEGYGSSPTQLAAAEKLRSLIRFDARSDRDNLEGRDLDQLRDIFNDHVGGKPLHIGQYERNLFLVADEEVFDNLVSKDDQPWVKAVEANYDRRSTRRLIMDVSPFLKYTMAG